MNKVIAAFDGLNLSESTVDYAIYLSKHFQAHVIAAFVEEVIYHKRIDKDEWPQYEPTDWEHIDVVATTEEKTRSAAVKALKRRLDAEGVRYNVRTDKPVALQSILTESHFADMLLIDADENFSSWDTSKPSRFLKNLLADADCPLMIVPREFKPIEKFVFCYDGSPSSVYAIRQFTYLFPASAEHLVEIMMVTDERHTNHFPNHHLLKELLKRKYSVVLQSIIKSEDTAEAMIEHLQTENKNCMVILGAYQRSSFSRWLQQSTADALIATLQMPLFIAHK
jgi:nucleotide-binding universal stress UspA family protein